MANTRQAVLTAIVTNGIVAVCKLVAALASGSASMMNEFIHSVLDTANQTLLFFGLREAERPADKDYAFGHHQKKYLWNLGSAVGLFSVGAGLGLMHAWHAWHAAEPAESEPFSLLGITIAPIWLSVAVLGIAFVLEGYSFVVAMREFLHRMRAAGHSSPLVYLRQSSDPTLLAVVLEDSLAVGGLLLAGIGIGLSAITGNAAWDIAFSAVIALLLGVVAMFLWVVNARYLSDMRDHAAERAFIAIADGHPLIERYHDVRSVMLDEAHTILVAEVELREEALVVGLGKAVDEAAARMEALLPAGRAGDPKLRAYIHNRAAVETVLRRTEQVIDEISDAVRQAAPQVVHCTIEVEGIANETLPTEGVVPAPA